MARGHLDGLADYVTTEVLKEGCENREDQNFGIRSLRELRKIHG